MGIKSFIARRAKPIKKVFEQIKVSDYMTRNLITFSPEQPLIEVINSLIKHRISGGPVINEKRELVGIISEGDCMKQISESKYYNQPVENINVEQVMAKEIETIDGNMNIFDASDKFLKSRRRRFPIIENGKLVGQISQKDVLKAVLKLNGSSWK